MKEADTAQKLAVSGFSSSGLNGHPPASFRFWLSPGVRVPAAPHFWEISVCDCSRFRGAPPDSVCAFLPLPSSIPPFGYYDPDATSSCTKSMHFKHAQKVMGRLKTQLPP